MRIYLSSQCTYNTLNPCVPSLSTLHNPNLGLRIPLYNNPKSTKINTKHYAFNATSAYVWKMIILHMVWMFSLMSFTHMPHIFYIFHMLHMPHVICSKNADGCLSKIWYDPNLIHNLFMFNEILNEFWSKYEVVSINFANLSTTSPMRPLGTFLNFLANTIMIGPSRMCMGPMDRIVACLYHLGFRQNHNVTN